MTELHLEDQRAASDELALVARLRAGDEQAFEVGLACGGIIDVFIEPLESLR